MSAMVAAVDLGATSGRVMLGSVGHNELALRPVARFPNSAIPVGESLHWDISALYEHVLNGLAAAVREEPGLLSIGVDSWAVDYALLSGGRMLGEPHHYRDSRNSAAADTVHAIASAPELYAANGLQHLPFNTLFQLTADKTSGALDAADSFLLVPDLLDYWLTGKQFAELSNASTTGLVGVGSRGWDDALIERLGLPRSIFATLIEAGTVIGALTPGVAARIGAGPELTVTTVGSHDTASAIVAIPSTGDDFAYISCGTWGLVGVELQSPVLTEASRLANFTNEGGVDGRVRYLHNVMGLWLLSESVREWERSGLDIDLPALIGAASGLGRTTVFDAEDPRFLAPGDMPARIAEWCVEHDVLVPKTPVQFVRAIIESLADAFAHALAQASELSGKRVTVVHVVGGGSQNALLCQLTADRSGLPVLAGPVEATAIGNVLIQARAQGLVTGSLESLRALVAAAFSPQLYSPRS